MVINISESTMSFAGISEDEILFFSQPFPFQQVDLLNALKYYIKPNDYGINDWDWLILKLERRLKFSYNRWLS
jgi:hypothetical protein